MRFFSFMCSNASVKSCVKDGIGEIILSRPQSLNALSLDMVEYIFPLLKTWDQDPVVKMVFIKGEGDKAFCAGGDVKIITENARQQDYSFGERFFKSEYLMNYTIGSIKKPYMALINGITMGGGVGISVHGKYRIATEKTDFAMPETAIGLFPDVGGSYFLPKLPHSLGLYLGLTGQRLKGYDVYRAGIATHFIPQQNVQAFQDKLYSLKDLTSTGLDKILKTYQVKEANNLPGHILTEERLKFIDKTFSLDSTPTINHLMTRLNASCRESKDDLLQKIPAILGRMSPTSLKLTFRAQQLSVTQGWNLATALTHEYRLVCRLLRHPDFVEGVRAALIDKDRKPKWNPSTLDGVRDQDIERMFEPLDVNIAQELILENKICL